MGEMTKYEYEWGHVEDRVEVKSKVVKYVAEFDAWRCDIYSVNRRYWSIMALYPEYFDTIKRGNIYRDIDSLYKELEERHPGGLITFSNDVELTEILRVIPVMRNIWGEITVYECDVKEYKEAYSDDVDKLDQSKDLAAWIVKQITSAKAILQNMSARCAYSSDINCIAVVSEMDGLNSAIQGDTAIWDKIKEVLDHGTN